MEHGCQSIQSLKVCFPLYMHKYSHKGFAINYVLLSRHPAKIPHMVWHYHQLSSNKEQCFLQPKGEIHQNKILFLFMNLYHTGERQYLSENNLSLTNRMIHVSQCRMREVQQLPTARGNFYFSMEMILIQPPSSEFPHRNFKC